MLSPSTIFCAAHLASTAIGIAAGYGLPWWFAGAPAYAMAIAAVWMRPFSTSMAEWDQAFWNGPAALIGERLRQLADEHAHRVTCLAHGLFWGAITGAAATSIPAMLDWLTWSGHDDAGLGALVAVLVSVAWTTGAALEDDDAPPLRPGLIGFGLYLVVVTLCALPALWEVL